MPSKQNKKARFNSIALYILIGVIALAVTGAVVLSLEGMEDVKAKVLSALTYVMYPALFGAIIIAYLYALYASVKYIVKNFSIGHLISTIVVVAALSLILAYGAGVVWEAMKNADTLDTFQQNLIPNVIKTKKELFKCLKQTLQMVGYSSLISAGFGILFGVTLVVTEKGNILDCPPIYQLLDKLINVFRSIPFIILVSLLIKTTRSLVGTSIGVTGAIFPLVVATVPFFSRQIHSALCEIDPGVVEAARSMGLHPVSIIFRVYLREGLPGMIRGATITIVNIIALTAMAGTVGGGGLGDYAIRYGYQRVMTDVTIVTIAIILLMVTIIQTIGTILERKLSH